jgi:DNA ligase (NAD+)
MATIAENSQTLLDRLKTLDADALETLVAHHNALYWEKAAPEIDDPTYDKLVEALRAARPDSPVLEHLGEQPSVAFGDVKHERPMLSLDKCYDDETLVKWAAGVKGGFLMTPKIDGLACSIRYDKAGRLKVAATRGDGKVGDDITANARGVKEIPERLPLERIGGHGAIEVRGEVYMRLSRFNAVYKGSKANPRNLAAGAIKTKDPTESAAYGLSFFAYDLLGAGAKSEHEKMELLAQLGFPVLPYESFQDGKALPDGFRAFVESIIKNGGALDTETDGVVVKADLLAEQDRLGSTAHHPRYAIAYKFQGESAITTVKEVAWSVARTGSVNPVAFIEPIFVSGVTVTKVSLHNAGYAQKLGIGAGSKVEVVRRGGVIPHVERVLSRPTRELELPTSWPVKDGATRVIRDGDFLFLEEPERSLEVVVDRVRHFAWIIDAKGFGEKVLVQLFEAGLVKTPADLYRLDVPKLAALERMGEKSARNLVDTIEARRSLTLPTFLEALGLERVGATVADKLAAHFHSLERLRAATREELSQIEGIGSEIAEAIVVGLKESAHVLDELLAEVKIVEAERPKDTGSPLFGKSVVFTGAMATMDRKTAQKRVQALGGKTPSSVTADLDFLVVGDEGSPLLGDHEKSTKHKAADKLIAKGSKVQIISESAFLQMLEGAMSAP